MKNKILALLATIGLASSVTAVEINDNISINGFIDGSWSSSDSDGNTNDESNLGLDEVELNFIVSAGAVSGEVSIDTNGGNLANSANDSGADDGLDIEQAHFTYSLDNGLSLQVGRFGSNLGFEREDPSGLYTFSRAYGEVTISDGPGSYFDLGNIDGVDANVLEGVRASYATDSVTLSVSVFNERDEKEETTDDGRDNSNSEDNLDYEITIGFNGLENLALAAGFKVHNGEQDGSVSSTSDYSISNITAAYSLDKLLLAAEYSDIDQEGAANPDLSAYMILADYDVNDKLGFAVRYSEWETTAAAETDKLTIAPNYAITDSLGAILEYSSTDNGAADEDQIALELTYTF